MSNFLWLVQPAAAPMPSEFAAYLRQRGWQLGVTSERWTTFTKAGSPEPFEVDVPQLGSAPDYPHAARILIENLSRIEAQDGAAILRNIKAVGADIIRLAIESSGTRDGRISVEAGRRVYEAARDMLLAAACSVGEPRAAFPRKKTNAAMELIRRARLGQTEVGSFVLTIECEVPQRLPAVLFGDEDSDAPMERQTCLRLAQALAGLGDATREAAGTATIEPFQSRISAGVSANLCDAMAEIIDATDADAVRASFSFASRRPVHRPPPSEVSFSRDSMGQLREAANRLRDEATYLAFEAEGHVVKLESPEASQGGTVVLHAEAVGGWRHVSVRLDAEPYCRAIEAHKSGSFVRCIGDLKKVGRSWTLLSPRGFEPVPER